MSLLLAPSKEAPGARKNARTQQTLEHDGKMMMSHDQHEYQNLASPVSRRLDMSQYDASAEPYSAAAHGPWDRDTASVAASRGVSDITGVELGSVVSGDIPVRLYFFVCACWRVDCCCISHTTLCLSASLKR